MSTLFIFLALGAQFINAGVTLADKYLVTSKKAIADPVTYAFYVALLSGVVIFLVPFGVISLPSQAVIWLSLATGLTFVVSLIFLYQALKMSDASDVAPVLGALTAIATLAFSFSILNDRLSGGFFVGFIFLVAGTGLMSYFRFNMRSFLCVLVAGTLLGLSGVLIKRIFLETTFIDGFFWTRMANVLIAVLLLFWPGVLKKIKSRTKESSRGSKWLIIGNKLMAGIAFFLVLYAIKIGNVSVVNALNGSQFLFLLLFAVIFTKKMPEYFFETVHKHVVVGQKLAGTLLIVAGLLFLFT
ncbi:MAG: DMT family transporter [bacterium]|nr:DMT family transporter [bacterium]